MDPARFTMALPDDADLIGRLTTALAAQNDPPISLSRSGETVVAFESLTAEMMLRIALSRPLRSQPVRIGRLPRVQSVSPPVLLGCLEARRLGWSSNP